MNDRITEDQSTAVSSLTMLHSLDEGHASFKLQNLQENILVGRDQEVALLQDAYRAVMSTGSSGVVFVHGPSGVGKSALVEVALRNEVSRQDGFFCQGKFDQLQRNDPYGAFLTCLTEATDLLKQHSRDLETVRYKLLQNLGDEIGVLIKLISGLAFLLQTDSTITAAPSSTEGINDLDLGDIGDARNSARAFSRFKVLCQEFLKCIATPRHPLCIFLDDIQWADTQTMDVLEALLKDSKSKHILFVCAYRDICGELKTSSRVEAMRKDPAMSTTDILIGDLDLAEVNDLLAGLLEMPVEETHELAEVVKQKTSGNPLFICQFCQLLELEEILRESEDGGWTWDLDRVKEETNVSANVVRVVEARIQKLSPNVQKVLILAAALGFQFDARILRYLHENLHESTIDLDQVLDHAAKDGFVEHCFAKKWKFTHDRFQCAFYDMVGQGRERSQMHFQIGKALEAITAQSLTCDGFADTDWLLFATANYQNMGSELLEREEERIKLAERNLKTGKRAVAKSAYGSAAIFFRNGISLVSENSEKWSRRYNLTLELTNEAANADHSAGDFETSRMHIHQVLENARSMRDKLYVYRIYVESLGLQGKFTEAISLGNSTLRQLGIMVPMSPRLSHVILSYLKTRTLVQLRNSNDSILQIPPMKDEEMNATMNLLSSVLTVSMLGEEPHAVAVTTMQMVRLTLKHGFSHSAPHSLALYGMFSLQLGKYKEAFQFGSISLKLLERSRARDVESKTVLIVFGFLHYLQCPLDDSYYDRLMRGYNSGMAAGRNEFAISNILTAATLLYGKGASLARVENQFIEAADKCVEFNQEVLASHSLVPAQSCRNLMGQCEDVFSLRSELMDEAEMEKKALSVNNYQILHTLWTYQFFNACWLARWVIAIDHLRKLNLAIRKSVSARSHFSSVLINFMKSMCGFAYFRICKRPKYKIRALRTLRMIEKRFRSGIQAYSTMLRILRAERVALNGKVSAETVEKAYVSAISEAEKTGAVHLQALTNERAGDVMKEMGLDDKARQYYQDSQSLFDQWGAASKVEILEYKLRRKRPDNDSTTASSMTKIPCRMEVQIGRISEEGSSDTE